MVAEASKSPAIYNDHGVVVHFESAWLKAALHRAARKAGHESWALLDEFSAAITGYMHGVDVSQSIFLDDLDRVVRATLRDIGFPEIAARFRTVNPYQSISLADSSQPRGLAGSRHPAPFLKRLAAWIEAMHAAKVQQLDFRDLQACARFFSNDETAGWWDQPLMRARIVTSIRDRIATLQWDGVVRVSVH